MTGTEFASYIHFLTKTNSATFTDVDVVLLSNTTKDDMATMIVEMDEDYFGTPMTRALIADVREYPLIDTLLTDIKVVEVRLDPDSSRYERAVSFDLGKYDRTTDEATVREQFAGKKPHYDVFRNSLWLYTGDPIVSVLEGLKMWGPEFPANINASTLAGSTDLSIEPNLTSHGFPREFHELWARKVAVTWKESQPGGQKLLTPFDLRWEVDMREKLNEVKPRSKDEEYIGRIPLDTGHNN